jgi:SAM-dependent methyltransferase
MRSEPIDPSREPAETWEGEEGRAWVATQARHDRMVAAITPILLDAADARNGDAVLDVGCGCGEMALRVASETSAGCVLGVDISDLMLDAARSRARESGTDRVDFLHADAETYRLDDASFDVVLSRFGVMFFANPAAAFANLARAMRRGARLAFVCWQAPLLNEWILVPGAVLASRVALPELGSDDEPGAFSMAEPDRIRSLLETAGLTDVIVDGLTVPVCLGTSAEDATDYLHSLRPVRDALAATEPDAVAQIMAEVSDSLRPYEGSDGVWIGSSTWLVTAHRR